MTRLPYIATLEDKPDWLAQAEAADRYNLAASARQGDDGEGPMPLTHKNMARPTPEQVDEYVACMRWWDARREQVK